MKEIKYKSRVYKTEAIIEKAGEDVRILAVSLLPSGYSIHVEECDLPSENEFTPRYKYLAKITPDYDAPHFITYSRTKEGVYAKVLDILFSKPIYPLTP